MENGYQLPVPGCQPSAWLGIVPRQTSPVPAYMRSTGYWKPATGNLSFEVALLNRHDLVHARRVASAAKLGAEPGLHDLARQV